MASGVKDLVDAGQRALSQYDYPTAEALFQRACAASGGALEAVEPLLTLWVDFLMADEQAIELGRRLPPATSRDPAVRLLLALAHTRQGQWRQAETLLRHDDHPRAIEAILMCARAALGASQTEQAELLLARARTLDPSEPGVHELASEIRIRRVSEQAAAEASLVQLIDRQASADQIEALAREFAGRWPGSGVAQAYLAERARTRAAAASAEAEAAAREARTQGDLKRAVALLRDAAGQQPCAERARELSRMARELEAEWQAREQAERVRAVVDQARHGQLALALSSYLALDEEAQSRVRAAWPQPALAWLDAMAPGTRRAEREAIAAVSALAESRDEVAANPQRVLERLGPYRGILRRLADYQKVHDEACRLVAKQELERACVVIDHAERLLGADDPEEAERQLGGLPISGLDEEQAARASWLRQEARNRAECLRLQRLLREHEARGEALEARSVAGMLCTKAPPSEHPRWQGEVDRLQASVHTQWVFASAAVESDVAWGKLVSGRCSLGEGVADRWLVPWLHAFIVPLHHGHCLTVLVVDRSTAKLKHSLSLDLPDDDCAEVRVEGSLLRVVGGRGDCLDIDLERLVIEGYFASPLPPDAITDHTILPASTPYAWVNYRRWDDETDTSRTTVIDLRNGTSLRSYPGSASLHEVVGHHPALVIIDDFESCSLCAADGTPNRRWQVPTRVDAAAAHPSGKGSVLLRNDDERNQLQLVELVAGQPPRLQDVFEGNGELISRLAVSVRLGRVFVMFAEDSGGSFLASFVLREGGLESDWRVAWPDSHQVLLLSDAALNDVVAVLLDEPVRSIELGAEPPTIALSAAPRAVRSRVSLDRFCAHAEFAQGDGDRVSELLAKPPAEFEVWLAQLERSEAATEQLIHWLRTAGLWWRGSLQNVLLLDRALRKREDDALVRLTRADQAAHRGHWAQVHRLLAGFDEVDFGPRWRQHFVHLRILCALERSDHATAWELCCRARELGGRCQLETLVALSVPLGALGPSSVLAATACDEPSERAIVAVRHILAAVDRMLEDGNPRQALSLLDDESARTIKSVQLTARRVVAYGMCAPATAGERLDQWLASAELVDTVSFDLEDGLSRAKEAWDEGKISDAVAAARAITGDASRARRLARNPSSASKQASRDRARETEPAAPRLGHESVECYVPALRPVVERIAATHAQVTDPGDPSFLEEAEVARSDALHRVLEARALRGPCTPGRQTRAVEECRELLRHATYWIAYELCHRKTFWVDQELAWMLAHTHLDISGSVLRLPYPSCAFVFTDGYALEVGAELVKLACPVRPRQAERGPRPAPLRVITAYLRETRQDEVTTSLDVELVLDRLDGKLPLLVSRRLSAFGTDNLDTILESHRRDAEERALDPAVSSQALQSLLHLVINAVLYATSAECERRELAPQRDTTRSPRRERSRTGTSMLTGETVFFLPGKLEISQTTADSDRGSEPPSSDRSPMPGWEILKRFPVRGHWRRPPESWKDQRIRWVRPHFRGPSMAAVIERQYRLKT